eukprot:CAMPEP_0119375762 /NCGR_PEP_ID=MMETSP1334-20130426/36599_1 /TAXON_ID=127549 /ORGANISM="Calcidiscus leptoporus, Strain RCC1130" /LENGTH=265 /DNA_ID=CAMNT_0007394147 /DNA_START=42 /DNA_END=839 /DNA_ORIENTATION=-
MEQPQHRIQKAKIDSGLTVTDEGDLYDESGVQFMHSRTQEAREALTTGSFSLYVPVADDAAMELRDERDVVNNMGKRVRDNINGTPALLQQVAAYAAEETQGEYDANDAKAETDTLTVTIADKQWGQAIDGTKTWSWFLVFTTTSSAVWQAHTAPAMLSRIITETHGSGWMEARPNIGIGAPPGRCRLFFRRGCRPDEACGEWGCENVPCVYRTKVPAVRAIIDQWVQTHGAWTRPRGAEGPPPVPAERPAGMPRRGKEKKRVAA